MKKMKKLLISALLVFTLCLFTACGNADNAADEVPQNTANEDNGGNIEEGTDTEDNLADDAGDIQNDGTAGGMTGGNTVSDDAVTPDGAADNNVDGGNTASGALGDGVEDLGDGVADGVRDIGDGIGNAVEDVGDAVSDSSDGR